MGVSVCKREWGETEMEGGREGGRETDWQAGRLNRKTEKQRGPGIT